MAVWVAAAVLLLVLLALAWVLLPRSSARSATSGGLGEHLVHPDSLVGKNTAGIAGSSEERQLADAMEFAGDDWRTGPLEQPERRAIIVYATEYGFGKEVAKVVAERLRDADWAQAPKLRPRVINVMDLDFIDWAQEAILIMVCSTTGDGVVPNDARVVYEDWTALVDNQDQNNSHDLQRCIRPTTRFAVLALGDSSYPHFCRAGVLFEQLLTKLTGVSPLGPRVDVDQEDWDAIDGWILMLIDALVSQDSITTHSKPDYLIESILSERKDLPLRRDSKPAFTRDNPLLAPMTKCKLLTNMTGAPDDKETVLVEFDIGGSAFTYTPGDALGVMSTNCPDMVEKLLITMATDGNDIVPVPASAASSATLAATAPLSQVLTNHCDLHNVKPDLVLWLAENCTDPDERELARTLIGASKKSQVVLDYLADRHLIDVLEDFTSALPSPTTLVEHLRPLTARYYSISSTQRKATSCIAITVGVVRYDSLGKSRTGVASGHLRDRLSIGHPIPIFISRNSDFRLPKDPATPIIMVGPGTGIAPFRAFLQERAMDRAEGAVVGEQVLFFGCRYKERDFLYADELQTEQRVGALKLHTAFSRDDETQKVYVQQRIREQGAEVWRLLQNGAHLYVCGDATKMAGDVRDEFLNVIQQHGGQTATEAEDWLDELAKAHRYQRDVWVS